MKKALLSMAMMLSFLMLFHSAAFAIPRLISYQGTLNDANGLPVSSTVSITFNIYDVETGGVDLWTETQNVAVSNGLFNVKLGSEQELPSSVFLSDELYLGIQVGADPEMVPRQRITPGAYVQTVVPIGSIMAWTKSLPGVPSLPESWAECNGQVLSDPDSPLNGQMIPDLNGENRFLRGAAASGGTGGEESHLLTVAEMASHTHNYSVSGGNHPGSFYGDVGNRVSMTRTTQGSGGNSPHENRPPYYEIVWIIRIK